MDDERRVGRRDGTSASRSGPTRRRLLATAGATALLAGCTDAITNDEDGANVADPETLDEDNGSDGEGSNESTETETDNGTNETETESETGNETETDNVTAETETDNGTDETETEPETDNETDETETDNETESETDNETTETDEETETETEEETETETEEETETETEEETETETETEEQTETETEEETETETETEEESGNPPLSEVIDHPSARNSDHSPVIGPYPTETDAAIVMFDDPGCPACADFEAEVMPDLREHTAAGELSIVWRGLGVISDWSDAALAIQWATYDRDAEAFWDLREYIFENRDGIDGDEAAIEESVSFLEENTSLDAAAIREEAESGAYDQRMAYDEDAAGRSGVDATPYFHLFRGGEHRTEIRGYQEYQVFQNTLEL